MNNSIDTLIVMANRIGNFFEAQPNREESLAGIATHIRNFWEPRMRTALLEFLEQHPDGATGTAALSPITLEAIQSHKESLVPRKSA